jgi:hypothetical protein
MNKTLSVLMLALSASVIAVAAPIDGVAPVSTAPAADETMVTVPVRESNGVRYMNGGAALERMAFMKAHASEFSAQFLFSGNGGAYGVAESVTVLDGERTVMSVANAGPMLLVQLPPGRYTVEARFPRGVERRTVVVAQGETKVNWNTPKASD